MESVVILIIMMLFIFISIASNSKTPRQLLANEIKKGLEWEYRNGILFTAIGDYDISDIVTAYHHTRTNEFGFIEYYYKGKWYKYESFEPTQKELIVFLKKSI